MKLAAPQMLWLLVILVAPLVAFFWWAWRIRQQLITQFISARLLGNLKVGVSPSRQKARMAMIVAAVVLIIFALAPRPQWGVSREEARQRGLDIILAVDTSNSMLAEDVSPSRLARAKLAALDLMRRATTDRLGLVAFAGDAFLECPLTLDDAAFSQSVNALDTSTISQGGTAIGTAIDEARKAFKKESDNHKVLVLLTDGEDHDSDAVSAAQTAAKEGMVIFTVGIGSAEGELLKIRDGNGHVDYIRDDQGQPVKSKLDEDLLQKIASVTHGFYLPLQGTKTMDYLYDRGIAPLPKNDKSVRLFQNYHERFQWPLAAAMLLLVLEMFLPDRSSRRSKRTASTTSQSAPANTLAETVAVVALLLALPIAAHGSPASALREYNEGNYDESLKDYDHLLEKETDDPRLHFNAGAAAYQSKQLDKAEKEFNAALSSPDLQLQQRAWYNLGNTMYRLGQQLSDTEKKQEAWTNAIRGYESALKLNHQDPDAKFNEEFVKKQLEELKQQQQQSQQNDKQNKDNKNDKKQGQNQQQQSGNDQKNKQDQQSQDQQNKQDQSKQGQNSEQNKKETAREKSDQEKQDEQSQAQKQKQDQQQQQQGEQNQASNDSKEKQEEQQREAAMMAAGEMTPQQAKQLLDAQKDDEHVFQLAPPNKQVSQSPNFKNW